MKFSGFRPAKENAIIILVDEAFCAVLKTLNNHMP